MQKTQPDNTQQTEPAVLGFPTQISKGQRNQGLTDFTDFSPDEAKASLGMATFLQDQLLPQGQQKQKMPSNSQGNPTNAQTEPNSESSDIEAKFQSFRKDIKDELSQIKELVKEVLNEDKQEDGQKET